MYKIISKEYIVRGDVWEEDKKFNTLDEAVKWVKKEAMDTYFKMEYIIKNDDIPVMKIIIPQRFTNNGLLPFRMEVEIY